MATVSDTTNKLKRMRVKDSILVGSYVVLRTTPNRWRLGEHLGDWLMSGTALEVAQRIIAGRRVNPASGWIKAKAVRIMRDSRGRVKAIQIRVTRRK